MDTFVNLIWFEGVFMPTGIFDEVLPGAEG